MFYNGLTVFDEKLVPQPDLAEAVESSDAKTWTIRLRKGVTFHDGAPFTSADVVFSLERHKDPKTSSVVRPLAEQMDEIKATGPLEVQITLTAPNPELPTLLAIYQFVIVKNGTTNFNRGIGTGPFRCQEFSPGVRSVGARNPNYFRSGQPYLDEVDLLRHHRRLRSGRMRCSPATSTSPPASARSPRGRSRPRPASKSSRPMPATTPT